MACSTRSRSTAGFSASSSQQLVPYSSTYHRCRGSFVLSDAGNDGSPPCSASSSVTASRMNASTAPTHRAIRAGKSRQDLLPLRIEQCGLRPEGRSSVARADGDTDIALRPDGVPCEKQPVPRWHLNRLRHLRKYRRRGTWCVLSHLSRFVPPALRIERSIRCAHGLSYDAASIGAAMSAGSARSRRLAM